MVTRGGGAGGIIREFVTDRYTLLCLKWIPNKDLLYSTGNFAQHYQVQFSLVTQSCSTPHDPMDCSRPGFPVHHQLPESTQPHVHWVSDAIQPSHPLSSRSPHLQSFPASRSFEDSVLRIRWPKYWSFSFSITPSKEYSGLISFKMDWLDLLAVQGTLKSLLQHHSSKASILWHSVFFTVQF